MEQGLDNNTFAGLNEVHNREELKRYIDQKTRDELKRFLQSKDLQTQYPEVTKEGIDDLLAALNPAVGPEKEKKLQTGEVLDDTTQELVSFLDDLDILSNDIPSDSLQNALQTLYRETQEEAYKAYATVQRKRRASELQESITPIAEEFPRPVGAVMKRLLKQDAIVA